MNIPQVLPIRNQSETRNFKSRLQSPSPQHCEMAVCLLRALEILCILSSDLIVAQVECSECLHERDRNEMTVKT